MQKLKRAAAYPRYSSNNQREESIEAQMKYINEFAAREGFEIVKVYPDEAKSATSDSRPNFQNLIQDSYKGLFDYVIVHKLDRFSRDRYDFAYYRRILRKNGVQLVSVLERLDDSPESIMMESVLEGMAEYYSKNLSREVMRKGMIPNAEKCQHNGGIPPLGYDVDETKHYVINEREAEAVRHIFSAYLAGEGYTSILSWLDANGYVSKVGNPIAKNSLHDILSNEKYTGTYIYNKTRRKDADGKRNGHAHKPESEIIRIEGGMPAIITKEAFARAQEKMRKNKSGSYRATEPYFLSGICFCGKCGALMCGTSKGKHNDRNELTRHYYVCGKQNRTRDCDLHKIKRDTIEEIVIAYLESLLTEDNIEHIYSWVIDNASKYESKQLDTLKQLKKEHRAVSLEIEKLLDKILDGLDSPAARQRLSEKEERKNTLELLITDKEAMTETSRTMITPQKIQKYLAPISGIRNKTREEAGKIIKSYVKSVTVNDLTENGREIIVRTNLDCFATHSDNPNGWHGIGGGEPTPIPCPYWIEARFSL